MSEKRSNFNNLSGIKLNAFETTTAANCKGIGRNRSGKITKYHKEGVTKYLTKKTPYNLDVYLEVCITVLNLPQFNQIIHVFRDNIPKISILCKKNRDFWVFSLKPHHVSPTGRVASLTVSC